ncbi:hypothetical protein [Flavobacterium hungaricum]|uniref:Uncharacterized protein n=1 Tax=Flavobacterium hungaricum TaxID=2082725 RepID=A0ABR9TDS2_9FLAO|nr:hypothetical protein [Flavobacterium hungaricum]MBE8723441.1 hypothetical protein [Flavobacterium hungaricum]
MPSHLEKVIQDFQHMNTPTGKFADFITKQQDYIRAKTDKERKKIIMEISQRFADVFNKGEYEELIKEFKN